MKIRLIGGMRWFRREYQNGVDVPLYMMVIPTYYSIYGNGSHGGLRFGWEEGSLVENCVREHSF